MGASQRVRARGGGGGTGRGPDGPGEVFPSPGECSLRAPVELRAFTWTFSFHPHSSPVMRHEHYAHLPEEGSEVREDGSLPEAAQSGAVVGSDVQRPGLGQGSLLPGRNPGRCRPSARASAPALSVFRSLLACVRWGQALEAQRESGPGSPHGLTVLF